MPLIIPRRPNNVYNNWISWSDFLGYTTNIRKKYLSYLSYDDAKIWISDNIGQITSKEYRKLSNDNKLPIFISRKPERYYKGIFTWVNYLGTKKKNKNFYLEFEDARRVSRSLKIKSNNDWRKWCKYKSKEFDRIPNDPTIYREWIDWYDWLGKTKKV